jgi:hypothetical protein
MFHIKRPAFFAKTEQKPDPKKLKFTINCSLNHLAPAEEAHTKSGEARAPRPFRRDRERESQKYAEHATWQRHRDERASSQEIA